MSLTSNGNGLSAADIAAVMGNNGYGRDGFGFGGDGGWWILVLLLALGNGGWGNGFGFGGAGAMMGAGMMDGMMLYPWMNQADITTSGFQNQATNTAISSLQNSVTSGFGDVQTALCGGFAGVNATVNGAQNALSQQLNTNQLSSLERSFAAQTANTQMLNSLQAQLAQCYCDNRLATANLNSTILSENCADRAALSDGVRDIIANQLANTQQLVNTTNAAVQGVMDKICQLELDAKNNRISELERQLTAANLAASQTAQTARLENFINSQCGCNSCCN